MFTKRSDEQGPHGGGSFDSVNAANGELNKEVSSTHDACVICFTGKQHLKKN